MDGVKIAIVGFIFVCIIMPQIIKNRHQYYMALAIVLVGMFFQVLANAFSVAGDPFWRFCYTVDLLIQAVAILLLVMAAGGLSVGELAGNMARAYEVMRRGEDEKEIIIPLPSDAPRPRYNRADSEAPTRYALDEAAAAGGYPVKKAENSPPEPAANPEPTPPKVESGPPETGDKGTFPLV
jgi:hypothetical protein